MVLKGQGIIVCKLNHFELFCPVLLPFGHISTKILLYFPIEALCLSISLKVIDGGQFLFNVQKFAQISCELEVNYGPQSETIVEGSLCVTIPYLALFFSLDYCFFSLMTHSSLLIA